jgi:hypothetical protein
MTKALELVDAFVKRDKPQTTADLLSIYAKVAGALAIYVTDDEVDKLITLANTNKPTD